MHFLGDLNSRLDLGIPQEEGDMDTIGKMTRVSHLVQDLLTPTTKKLFSSSKQERLGLWMNDAFGKFEKQAKKGFKMLWKIVIYDGLAKKESNLRHSL